MGTVIGRWDGLWRASAAETRVADPIIGALTTVQQWPGRCAKFSGSECQLIRAYVVGGKSVPSDVGARLAGMRGAGEALSGALDNILARPGLAAELRHRLGKVAPAKAADSGGQAPHGCDDAAAHETVDDDADHENGDQRAGGEQHLPPGLALADRRSRLDELERTVDDRAVAGRGRCAQAEEIVDSAGIVTVAAAAEAAWRQSNAARDSAYGATGGGKPVPDTPRVQNMDSHIISDTNKICRAVNRRNVNLA
jgi:hypothetical protein